MSPHELESLLKHLIDQWENELIEFKEADNNYSIKDIGQYFSALSNEANLKNADSAWLVFGVEDKTKQIVGTNFRLDPEDLQKLKHQISQILDPDSTFKDIHCLHHEGKRVLLFQIPAAPRGIPIACSGSYYGRNHDSLVKLNLTKLDEIRAQSAAEDWSARICSDATIAHLDPAALDRAREIFANRQQDQTIKDACLKLSNEALLEKLELTHNKKLTRACLLLLGKAESAYLLSPFVAQLTWKLEGPERVYEHFSIPFLLTTSLLYQKIRNIRLSFLPDAQLIPVDISKYDQGIVLEALHNCIAHQDYRACERVVVIERPSELELSNAGNFYDGEPLDYILGNRTPRRYRNKVLANAMHKLRMMDTLGFGIREVMFAGQAKRYLPLPTYDLTDVQHVTLTIPGHLINENYSKALFTHKDITLSIVYALDKIQKGVTPTTDEIATLRQHNLIEGRKPSFYISASVAAAVGEQSRYMRTRRLDDAHYKHLILSCVEQFGETTREQIREMLEKKWPENYSMQQRENKTSNLLTALKKEGQLVRVGSLNDAKWILSSFLNQKNNSNLKNKKI